MSKIIYANKVALNQNSNIADINKVKADDMNEIKTVVNTNYDEFMSSWLSAGETWTYASVDNPTGVITISGDVTTKYSLGMRIKFTNGGNVIYGIITKISYSSPNTTLSFLHEINPSTNTALHLIANSAITNNYYSNVKVPFGFPIEVSKWSITYIRTTAVNQANPTKNIYYNLGGLSFNVPIGEWEISFKGNIYTSYGSAGDRLGIVALSTTNNNSSHSQLKSGTYIYIGSSGGLSLPVACPPYIIAFTAKTPLYIVESVADTNSALLQLDAGFNPFFALCKCAYL